MVFSEKCTKMYINYINIVSLVLLSVHAYFRIVNSFGERGSVLLMYQNIQLKMLSNNSDLVLTYSVVNKIA